MMPFRRSNWSAMLQLVSTRVTNFTGVDGGSDLSSRRRYVTRYLLSSTKRISSPSHSKPLYRFFWLKKSSNLVEVQFLFAEMAFHRRHDVHELLLIAWLTPPEDRKRATQGLLEDKRRESAVDPEGVFECRAVEERTVVAVEAIPACDSLVCSGAFNSGANSGPTFPACP